MEQNLILTAEKYFQRRSQAGEGILTGSYFDSVKGNSFGEVVRKSNGQKQEIIVTADKGMWVNSAPYAELWNKIETTLGKLKAQYERRTNIENFPDNYYDLIEMVRIDITRRRMEQQDFTGLLTQEITNPNFSRSVALLEFLPYAGVFKENSGTGQNVPMIEAKTGEKGSVYLAIYALGFARTLEDELYNLDIYTLQKVNAAVARAYTALRNDLTIGQLVAHTTAGDWDASQQVTAVTTGATLEQNIYDTLHNAVRTLGGLMDWQTNQNIGFLGATLIVGSEVNAWDINRVMRGQLAVSGEAGGALIKNVGPLPIDEIWVYKGDRIPVGPQMHVYPGVADNTAYLVIPGSKQAPFFTLVKRGLTQEVGRGSVLNLSREERAWYFAQGGYSDEFFGSTGGLGNPGDGYGYCVEITIPDEDT